MFISKKIYFFQSPSSGGGGGVKMSGGPTFSKVMGPNCFFSIERVVFQGSPPPLDSRIAYQHVSMFVAF